MSVKTETLKTLIKPVVESFGLKLWGLQYVSQGTHTLLRVFIDKDTGVNVEDCATVSRQLSAVLDVEDPISSRYTLEVSSPGLDRQLFEPEQYQDYVGKELRLKLNRAIDNRKKFRGKLISVDVEKKSITFEFEEQTLVIDLMNIEKATVVDDLA